MKSGVGSLEGVLAKFSGRIAKLPVEFQAMTMQEMNRQLSTINRV